MAQMPCMSPYALRHRLPLSNLDRNVAGDYSSAYITLFTDSDLEGHGMTFTIGRGTDIVWSPLVPQAYA